MEGALLERWAKRLQNLTVSHLPSDYTRPSPPRLVEAALSRSIDPEIQLALFRLALQGTGDSQPTSSFTILLSAFLVLVQRLTGDEDISVGTSSEGGDPFVLRAQISPADSFATLLARVKKVTSVKTHNLTARLNKKAPLIRSRFMILLIISENPKAATTPQNFLFSICASSTLRTHLPLISCLPPTITRTLPSLLLSRLRGLPLEPHHPSLR